MSATNMDVAPTISTVGFSTSPTTYPDGIAARMTMIKASKFSNAPALELFATIADIAKFIFTLIVESLITVVSIYGEFGTMTIAGGIGASGTLA